MGKGIDRIMLDNMDVKTMTEAGKLLQENVKPKLQEEFQETN